jgi:hypothetical protein
VQGVVSLTPTAVTAFKLAESATSGLPQSRNAAMAAAYDTPNSQANAATEASSAPTRRQISARARSVNTARRAIASLTSVHVLVSQSPSRQRQAFRVLQPADVLGRDQRVSQLSVPNDESCYGTRRHLFARRRLAIAVGYRARRDRRRRAALGRSPLQGSFVGC